MNQRNDRDTDRSTEPDSPLDEQDLDAVSGGILSSGHGTNLKDRSATDAKRAPHGTGKKGVFENVTYKY